MNTWNGFSLIELMVVIAIVAVLSAVAVPSYKSHAARAKITDLFSKINIVSQKEIEYLNKNGSFGNAYQIGVGVNSGQTMDANWAAFSQYFHYLGVTGGTCTVNTAGKYARITAIVSSPNVGLESTVAFLYILTDLNGVVTSKCYYNTDYMGGGAGAAELAAKYLPSFCQTPLGSSDVASSC